MSLLNFFSNLYMSASDIVSKQSQAPVANDVEWWIIALSITAGAAIFSTGIDGTGASYIRKGWLPKKSFMLIQTASTLLALVLGGLCGWRVWDWMLGGLCGFLGGASSGWILKAINPLIGKFFGKTKTEIDGPNLKLESESKPSAKEDPENKSP
jgi:hypothetical protein